MRSESDGCESMNRRSRTPWDVPELLELLFCVTVTEMLLAPMPDIESMTEPVMLFRPFQWR